jgi:hypothetical protein
MVLSRLGATGLTLVVLAACSSDEPTPTPTPNASTLFVHTLYGSGPTSRRHPVNTNSLGNVSIRVRAANGVLTDAKTDQNGNATLVLSSGVYTAWAYDCGSGIKYPVKVRVPGHGGAVQVDLTCWGVG